MLEHIAGEGRFVIVSLEIWDNRNINARTNGRSDNPGNIRSQGISQNKRVRIIFAHQLLSHFSGSGYTTDGRNSDHRIIISLLDKVHDVSTHDAADTGKQ